MSARRRIGPIDTGTLIVVAALSTACSTAARTPQVPDSTVPVGDATIAFDAIRCTRSQSYLTVAGHRDRADVTIVLDVSDVEPKVAFARLRDVDGFSGDVWQGGVGRADLVSRGRDYVVNGSAYGF